MTAYGKNDNFAAMALSPKSHATRLIARVGAAHDREKRPSYASKESAEGRFLPLGQAKRAAPG